MVLSALQPAERQLLTWQQHVLGDEFQFSKDGLGGNSTVFLHIRRRRGGKHAPSHTLLSAAKLCQEEGGARIHLFILKSDTHTILPMVSQQVTTSMRVPSSHVRPDPCDEPTTLSTEERLRMLVQSCTARPPQLILHCKVCWYPKCFVHSTADMHSVSCCPLVTTSLRHCLLVGSLTGRSCVRPCEVLAVMAL